ncbi:MAG: hypothetical protein LBG80_11080 [Bacteroidales bacterium]|jgi:hypothetical protein|nr:hypothetical protein [Bacteroidales bacterium]
MKTLKILKNVSLKKGLLLLATGAFIALCTFNVMLGLSDYDKTPIVSSTTEALADGEGSGDGSSESCLQAQAAVRGPETVTSQLPADKFCYQDRTGPDLYAGTIVQCTAKKSSSNNCTPFTCRDITGCYLSNQVPSSANY